MIHLLIALWITAIGVVIAAPASRWLTWLGIGALAPALGIAVYLIVGTILASIGAFSVVLTLTTATVASLLLYFIVTRWTDGEINLRSVLTGGAVAAGIVVVVSGVMLIINTARFTNDSFGYLMVASALEQAGGLDTIGPKLVRRLLSVPLIQAIGWTAGDGYSPVVGPLFGAVTLSTLGWLANRIMGRDGVRIRNQVILIAAAGLFLLTTNRFVFQATYISGHMLIAMLLLVGVGLSWLGVVEGEHRFMYLAGLAFAAVAISRAEIPIVVAMFLVPIIARGGLSLRDRLAVTLPTAILTLLWFGLVLPPHVPGSGFGTSPFYGNAAIALLLGLFASLAGIEKLRRVVVLAPWLMLGGVLAVLTYHINSNPQLMGSTMSSLAANISFHGAWGLFWYVVLPLMVAAMAAERIYRAGILNFGIIGFFLTLPLLSHLRGSAFRLGPTDSGNRMLFHIVPLLVTYLVIAAGQASTEADSSSSDRAANRTAEAAE